MGSSYGTFTITDINDVQQIWHDSNGTHMVATKEGLLPPTPFVKGDESTYGSNSVFGANQLAFKYDAIPITTIGTDGINLYSINWDEEEQIYTNNLEATINTQGLTIKNGGLEAGNREEPDPETEEYNYVYVWSEDRPDREMEIGSSDPKDDWRIVAGDKFGVDKGGNLYASNAKVAGDLIATSLTISGNEDYDGIKALNASGYTIEIHKKNETDISVYLYPLLYHNGVLVTDIVDYTQFIWYKDDENPAVDPGETGSNVDGGITAFLGHVYKVTYGLDDSTVDEGTTVITQRVDPQKYITKISDNGIIIHPEFQNNTTSIRLDGTGLDVIKNEVSIAKYGDTARIGTIEGSRFLINSSSLQAYDSYNNEYFHVDSNGLTWGGDNTAATTDDIDDAISVYITDISSSGAYVHAASTPTDPSLSTAKGVKITDRIDIIRNGISIASYGEDIIIGDEELNNVIIDLDSIAIRDGMTELARFGASGMQIGKDDARHIELSDTGINFVDELGQTVGTIRRDELSKHRWFAREKYTYPPEGGVFLAYDGSDIYYYDMILGGSTAGFMYTESKIDISVKIGNDIGTCTLITDENNDSDTKSFTVGSKTLIANIEASAIRLGITIGDIDSSDIENTTAVMSGYSYRIYKPTTTVSFGNDGNVYSSGNTLSFGYGSVAKGIDRVAIGTNVTAQPKNAFEGGTRIALGVNNLIPAGGDRLLVVGNGEDEPSNALELLNNGDMIIAGTLTQGSDKRLKEHVSYLNEDAVNFIRKLKPTHYIKDEVHHVGFYAQDVKEADEWDCMTGEMNGYMTLGYTELIAPLVTYCQYLEDRIKKLEGGNE